MSVSLVYMSFVSVHYSLTDIDRHRQTLLGHTHKHTHSHTHSLTLCTFLADREMAIPMMLVEFSLLFFCFHVFFLKLHFYEYICSLTQAFHSIAKCVAALTVMSPSEASNVVSQFVCDVKVSAVEEVCVIATVSDVMVWLVIQA